MTRFTPPEAGHLHGRVVVLTGGASGIGRATIQQLHALGAKVIFGDMDVAGAAETVSMTSAESVHFLKTDVRQYADNVALFKLAMDRYGQVDHAIANAGVVELGGWFNPRRSIEEIAVEPSSGTTVIDINLIGVINFAHIALTYLAHGNDGARLDRSLTLLSSVAGWKETPGLFLYQASKHGVLGLMRSLRLYAPQVYNGVRVNAVCPSMTDTRMVAGIKAGWLDAGLPVNTPDMVGKVLVGICAARAGSSGIWEDGKSGEGSGRGKNAGGSQWAPEAGLNGRAIYVIGGECWDIEEGLDKTQHLWLGEDASDTLTEAQKGLGDGTQWVADK